MNPAIRMLFILSTIEGLNPPPPPELGFWVDQDNNYVSDNTDTPILYSN